MNLNTYTLVHILHLLCTLTIYLLIYTYTCTSACHFIVLCRCCSFCKLRVCGNSGLSDDSQHFSAIKYFKVRVCTFFRQNIQHTEQCRVNISLYALGNQRICVTLFIASSLYYGSLESNQEYLRGMVARSCCGCSVAKSCARLCDPMECSAPGSSILHYVMEMFIESVLLFVATCSGKQTPSEGQCRWGSALYYTGGPEAESPLSQGLRPAFVKVFYTPCARV